MPILVTYATLHGSTREIADRIASRLHANGFAVDCRPVDHVFSVENYSAVILGSAVHGSKWLLDAQKFLDVEAMGLQMRPTWTFSVGMAPAVKGSKWVRDRAVRRESQDIRDTISRKLPKVRDHHLFAGKDDGSEMSGPVKCLWSCMGGRFGDYRDWNEIDEWADVIAKELKLEGT
ncbi:flavodoxin-like protein [Cladophialophora carrionii]|uniref:Flavodoxin-like protein n=1 Tax=Cladophialophora carrionii TaxID=86049 RepID=A0A1C1CK45_9EURO|nr:flavodoxin-like protein [Cladophialophora carrionii]